VKGGPMGGGRMIRRHAARLCLVGALAGAGIGTALAQGVAAGETGGLVASPNPGTDAARLGHFNVKDLFDRVNAATQKVEDQLNRLKDEKGNISIAQMFEMQMLMNRLSQLSEMSTSIVSASNSAIASMARNVKS
jgi:hypothetical protein